MRVAVYLVIGFVVAVICAAVGNFYSEYDHVVLLFIMIGWPLVVLGAALYGISSLVIFLGNSIWEIYRKVMKKWNA